MHSCVLANKGTRSHASLNICQIMLLMKFNGGHSDYKQQHLCACHTNAHRVINQSWNVMLCIVEYKFQSTNNWITSTYFQNTITNVIFYSLCTTYHLPLSCNWFFCTLEEKMFNTKNIKLSYLCGWISSVKIFGGSHPLTFHNCMP